MHIKMFADLSWFFYFDGAVFKFYISWKVLFLVKYVDQFEFTGGGGYQGTTKGYFSFGRCTYRPLLSLGRPLPLEWPALDERMYPMTRRKSSQLHREAHKPRNSSYRKKIITLNYSLVPSKRRVPHKQHTSGLEGLQDCLFVPLKRHIKTYWFWKELFNYWHHWFVPVSFKSVCRSQYFKQWLLSSAG